MIEVSQTVIVTCDSEWCNEKKTFSGFFKLGATEEEMLLTLFEGTHNTIWRVYEGKVFCSLDCQESVFGEED